MLAKRNKKILIKLLEATGVVTMETLSKNLEISPRSIRYDFIVIDDFLKQNQFPLVRKIPSKGVVLTLSKEDKLRLLHLIKEDEIASFYTKKERQFVLLTQLIRSGQNLKIADLSAHLQVSSSTINADILFLKTRLGSAGLSLSFDVQKRYFLSGDERAIRRFYSNQLIGVLEDHLDLTGQSVVSKDESASNLIDFDFIKAIVAFVESVETKESVALTEESFLYIIAKIYTMVLRLHCHHFLSDLSAETKGFVLQSGVFQSVNAFKSSLESYFHLSLSQNETIYITQYFMSLRLVTSKIIDSEKAVYLQFIVKLFIEDVSKHYGCDFTAEPELFKNLMLHIEPLFYRLMFHVHIENPLLTKIKHQYAPLFDCIKNSSFIIEDFCGTQMTEHEISYLVIHFGLIVGQENKKNTRNKKVLLVCPSGYATSMLLYSALKANYFVDVVDILPLRDLESRIKEFTYDYLISTVELYQFQSDYLKVNPILNEGDIAMLDEVLIQKQQQQLVNVNDLLHTIRRNCTIQNEENLIKELGYLVGTTHTLPPKKEIGNMLIDVIDQSLIELDVTVSDWKEAIAYGGNLLVKNGIATERYVDAMIQTAINLGPYIVLSEGIALPHAKPVDGAKKIGVSLITLKNPIPFGHKEHDPVRLVICLASIDSKSHLQVLSDIGCIFDGDTLYNQILNAKSKIEVLSIIENIGKEED